MKELEFCTKANRRVGLIKLLDASQGDAENSFSANCREGGGVGGVGGSLDTFLFAKFSYTVRKIILSILIYRGKFNQKKRKSFEQVFVPGRHLLTMK